MTDMGMKRDTGEMAMPTNEKSKVSYPSFSICGEQILDELANAKVGDTCKIEMLVKKISDSVSSYNDDEQRVELEIRKMGYKGSSKVSADEYKNMSSEEKDEADAEDVLGKEE